jgi:predicted amidohydrolase
MIQNQPTIRVAAYQGTPAETLSLRYQQIHAILSQADAQTIDIICFPEGFLTGYYDGQELMHNNSFNVQESAFQQFLDSIQNYRVTVIIGFNEHDNDLLFDSAAVIEQGKLLGVQRKHYKYHDFCQSGTDFFTFTSKGICFGVIVCLDANYFEPSRLCALDGATILFVPMCNKVSPNHPFAGRPPYYSHFIARTHENRCWLVAADWVWPHDGTVVCPGHSVVYNPDGCEMARSREGEDILIIDIPSDQLFSTKGKRMHGSAMLWQKIVTYQK